nr:MAG TPA: hypothetical protein [Caudoviricetes sp.]
MSGGFIPPDFLLCKVVSLFLKYFRKYKFND